MTPIYKIGAALVAAALLVFGALWYRHSLIQDGIAQEHAAALARQEVAVSAARADAAALNEKTAAALQAQLTAQKAQSDARTKKLEALLADSDLRNQRLSARIAGLLDDAAGAVRPGPAPAAGGVGEATGASQADQAQPADASVADLIESVNENYAACKRNATRLEELQNWYRALRASRAAHASPEAPGK